MLRKLIPFGLALTALISSSCAPAFIAPPHLVAAWPVAGASLSVARHTFELTLDRPLRSESTSTAVWHDEDDAPLNTDVVIDGSDARRLRGRLAEPAPGAYQLR